MNITTGTGQIAWRPQRLSVEAFALGASAPTETIPSGDRRLNVLEGTFPYGSLGTSRSGGTCVLSQTPAGWDAAPWPRLLRFRLESEHGTGYVYSAIAKEVTRDGRRANVELMAVQARTAGQLQGSTFKILEDSTPSGKGKWFGVAPEEEISFRRTREDFFNELLADQLNAEWGIGADLVAVAGKPEASTPVRYAVDGRALNVQRKGFVIPDAASGWYFDPGEEWEVTTTSRPVPDWAPERYVAASADPATLKLPVDHPADWLYTGGAYTVGTQGTYQDGGYRWFWDFVVPAPGPTLKVNSAKIEVKFSLQSVEPVITNEVLSVDGMDTHLQFGLYDVNNELLAVRREPLLRGMNGVFIVNFDVPKEQFGQSLQMAIYLAQTPPAHRVTMTLLSGKVTQEEERPNVGGIVVPKEFRYPFWAGPAHGLELSAWVVPPGLIGNLPGAAEQWLALSEVHWTGKGARSILETAALPWR